MLIFKSSNFQETLIGGVCDEHKLLVFCFSTSKNFKSERTPFLKMFKQI